MNPTLLRLRFQRIACGWSQADLADALEIPPHHLSLMECGRKPIPPEIAEKIERLLSVSLEVADGR